MRRSGAKQLGVGTYGIAVSPAIICEGYPIEKPGTIGKIYFSEKHAEEAWSIVDTIKKIDKGPQKYFIYPTMKCMIDSDTAIRSEPGLQQEFLKTKKPVPSFFQQQIMNHGGITLYKYMSVHYSRKNKISRAELIHLVENLFYAIKRLNDNKYVHQDVKTDNVIVSNKNRLRLIDFDLMTAKTRDAIYTNSILTEASYHALSPPEYLIFAKFYDDRIPSVASVLKFPDLGANKVFMDYFLGDTDDAKQHHEDDISAFIDQVAVAEQNVITFWLENDILSKSDIYSLGLSILWIYAYYVLQKENEPHDVIYYREDARGPHVVKGTSLETNRGKTTVKSISVVDAFNTLMKGMLWHNPLNRFSIEKAILWVKLIKSFPHNDPFKTNADSSSLVKDMRSKASTASLSNTTRDGWFEKLQGGRPSPTKTKQRKPDTRTK
jgi:serine/threonine protein kinase